MKQKLNANIRFATIILLVGALGIALGFYYLGYNKGILVSESRFYDDKTYALPSLPPPQIDKYFGTRQYLFGRWQRIDGNREIKAYRINNTVDIYNEKDNNLIGHHTWSLVQRPEQPNAFYILEYNATGASPNYYLIQKIDDTNLQLQDSGTNQIINYIRQ